MKSTHILMWSNHNIWLWFGCLVEGKFSIVCVNESMMCYVQWLPCWQGGSAGGIRCCPGWFVHVWARARHRQGRPPGGWPWAAGDPHYWITSQEPACSGASADTKSWNMGTINQYQDIPVSNPDSYMIIQHLSWDQLSTELCCWKQSG